MLRLLKLPEFVKSAIRSAQLSAGHARALIGHPEPERLARQIIERGLNVRQVEALTRDRGQAKEHQPRKKEADTIAMEKHVSDALGLAVTVDHRNNGGAVHIKYRNLDQLRDIVRRLVRAPYGPLWGVQSKACPPAAVGPLRFAHPTQVIPSRHSL